MGLSKSKVFVGVVISFGLGILLASKFTVISSVVYECLAVIVLVFALAVLNKYYKIALGALFLFSISIGILRLNMSFQANQFQGIFGEKQKIEGYIIEDADIRNNLQLLTFRPKSGAQNILITTTLAQEFNYGDWVVVEGKVEEVKNFGDFDYEKYLERFNTYAVIRYPKILILKSHQLNPLKDFLIGVKKSFTQRVGGLYKEPEGSLLLGILIGAKKSLPKNVVDNFNATGTSHIIAVSGFNITIIISALAMLAYVFGRKTSFYIAVCTIACFVVITGASASVVRAGIMGFLLLLAMNIGRQYSIAPAIFLSAFLMLLQNPKILFWDVGFQLSFCATLGIVYFIPLLNTIFEKFPKIFGVKTLILTTMSAIISTLPIILLNFGTLSFSAPVVNLLVLPLVPFAMLFGFLSILPFVGPGFAFITTRLLKYILFVVDFFAKLPYSNLNLKISIWLFWLLVVVVFGLYFTLRFYSNKKEVNVE